VKNKVPEEFFLDDFLALFLDENLKSLRHLAVSYEPK
jgi:hypothetical protein